MSHFIASALDGGFVYLEIKEWKGARRLFDDVLKTNPCVSNAYLGKCMADLHIERKEDIFKKGKKVFKNRNFQLALQFAEGQELVELQKMMDEIQNDIKQKKMEISLRRNKVKRACLVAVVCVLLLFCVFVGYNYLVNPMVQYSQAKKLLDDGEYDKAIRKFESLKSYKDSEELYTEARYAYAVNLYNMGNFAECAKIFSQIKGYKDSDTYLEKEEIFWRTKGNIITLGTYEQDNNFANGEEKVEWIILDPEYSNDSVMLISKYCLEYKLYDENDHCAGLTSNEKYNQSKDLGIGWIDCTLRAWLNDSFYNAAFETADKKILKPIKLIYSLDDKKYLTDNVSILSAEEAKKLFANTTLGIATETRYAHQTYSNVFYDIYGKEPYLNYNVSKPADYWLRKIDTMPMQDTFSQGVVFENSALYMSYALAVRPIIVVSVNSSIGESIVCQKVN